MPKPARLKTHGAAGIIGLFEKADLLYRDIALHELGRNAALLLARHKAVNDDGDVPGRIDFSVAYIHDCP